MNQNHESLYHWSLFKLKGKKIYVTYKISRHRQLLGEWKSPHVQEAFSCKTIVFKMDPCQNQGNLTYSYTPNSGGIKER